MVTFEYIVLKFKQSELAVKRKKVRSRNNIESFGRRVDGVVSLLVFVAAGL